MSSEEVAQERGRASTLDHHGSTKATFNLSFVIGVAALASIYFVTARLSLLLAIPPGYATEDKKIRRCRRSAKR